MSKELTPERLVGLGFRGWMSGYDLHDLSCWEAVWDTYACALGPKKAKRVVGNLSTWVRATRKASCRTIETLPLACSGFTSDERIAVSIIAACQIENCPALNACAFALLGTPHVDPMVREARDFANLLAEFDCRVPPAAIGHFGGQAVATKHLSN